MSGAMPGEIDRRRAQRAVRRRDLHDVAVADAELRGRRRIDLDPAAPHRRRQRVGHLLQPRQVRQRAVEKVRRGVRQEVERELLPRRRRTAARRTSRARRGARRRRRGAAPPSEAGSVPHQPPFSCASVQASPPSAAGGNAANVAPSISSNVSHGRSSGVCRRRPTSSSTSARRARLVQRRHHRRRHAGHGRPASPIRARPRPTTRGTSGRAGSDRPGRWSRPGSCRS